MSKSSLSTIMDELQKRVRPLLAEAGFRTHGRTLNRTTNDGLVQVVNFQTGAFDPPGTTYIPGLRENLYGRFTVNLGVCIPEVVRLKGGRIKSIMHDYDCCIRTRLGRTKDKEFWWKVISDLALANDISALLQHDALPFFARYETRNQILAEFRDVSDNTDLMATPKIVCALILFERGERAEAEKLLLAQAREQKRNPGHSSYVVSLASKLGMVIAP